MGLIQELVFLFSLSMENLEEKACLCALNRIFGFEPRTGLTLLNHCGSAIEVFRLKEHDLNLLLGAFSKYRGKVTAKAVEQAEKELLRLVSQNIRFCGYGESSYPTLLAQCEDSPIGLYIRSASSVEELWKNETISIVGTRDISLYGRQWCDKIVTGLSETDRRPTIVSGLALGTDITAHRCAIECGLPTIAVMATGPDSIYPIRHHDFAERMAATPGCALISDYPPGTAPLAIHFLRRNRIIAGLSKATILIESKIKGGGMMTCRLAFSYDRDVFCLPGRIDDIRSQGCNELIRQKIAEPITSINRLTDSLGMARTINNTTGWESLLSNTYNQRLPQEDLSLMSRILLEIRKNLGISLDELTARLFQNRQKISELVNMLEIDGFISIDLFQRCSVKVKKM